MVLQSFAGLAAAPTAHLRATTGLPSLPLESENMKAAPPIVTLQVLSATRPAVATVGLMVGAAAAMSMRRLNTRKALVRRRAAPKVGSKSAVLTYVDGRARFVVSEAPARVLTYVDGRARFVVDEARAQVLTSKVLTYVDGRARFIVNEAPAEVEATEEDGNDKRTAPTSVLNSVYNSVRSMFGYNDSKADGTKDPEAGHTKDPEAGGSSEVGDSSEAAAPKQDVTTKAATPNAEDGGSSEVHGASESAAPKKDIPAKAVESSIPKVQASASSKAAKPAQKAPRRKDEPKGQKGDQNDLAKLLLGL